MTINKKPTGRGLSRLRNFYVSIRTQPVKQAIQIDIRPLIAKVLRCIYSRLTSKPLDLPQNDSGLIEFRQEEGNDYILKKLRDYDDSGATSGMLLAKFGTTELRNITFYLSHSKKEPRITFSRMIHTNADLDFHPHIQALSFLSGLFPSTKEEADILCEEYLNLLPQLDILCSYQPGEQYLVSCMPNCHYVDLDAFYAPYKFAQPWTQWLEGKRVLVVHPFVESIRKQYEENRTRLFDNPLVLPQFKSLECIKSVVSFARSTPEGFHTWHEALQYMKDEMTKKDFDVALIGCGAYGMPLAAHAKSMGKVGIQLAGWTQMLFGVYGERWVSQQSEYSRFINEYWIRPNESEKPSESKGVENGCYW